MSKKKFYIGGSLFNEAEVSQRLKEEQLLRELGFEDIYNPINAPCNAKEDLPTCADIFWGDTKEILTSDVVTMDISNPADSGENCELGIIWMCNYLHRLKDLGLTLDQILNKIPKKQLIAVNSDIRKSTAHCYKGDEIPVGFNQYQIGLIKDIGVIKNSFNELLEELENNKFDYIAKERK